MCVLQPWSEKFHPTLTAILLGYIVAAIDGITQTMETFTIFHYEYLQKKENQAVCIFWSCLSGAFFSAVLSLVMEEQTFQLEWNEWILVFGHCASYCFIYPLFFYSCTRIPGTLVSLLLSTSTVYVIIAQYSLSGLLSLRPGNHNLLEVCGAGGVLISSGLASIVKGKMEKV